MDNKFNQAAKHLMLLLATDIISFLVSLVPTDSMSLGLEWAMLFITMGSGIINLYALYKIYKIFGGGFKRAFICTSMSLISSVLLLLFVVQSWTDYENYILITLVASIMALLGYYFLLTAFAALCDDIKNPSLQSSFIRVRSIYLAVIIGGILIALAFSGALDFMVELASYGIRVYTIFLYNRLRKELAAYKEPDEMPGIEQK